MPDSTSKTRWPGANSDLHRLVCKDINQVEPRADDKSKNGKASENHFDISESQVKHGFNVIICFLGCMHNARMKAHLVVHV